MKIKKFLEFINEELVSNIDNIQYDNIFAELFNSDPLKLKEFIQYNFNLNNLKFIAGGAIGLAFLWEDKVIKFTTDLAEKNGVEKIISLSKGKYLPGFAKYFWIKEIELPNNLWKKQYKNTDKEKVRSQRITKHITGNKQTQLSDEEILNRKSETKTKTAYIICMEKLKMLDDVDTEIAHFIFLMTKHKYLIPEKNNDFKLKSLLEWIKSDDDVYTEKEWLKNVGNNTPILSTFNKGLTKAAFFSTDETSIKKYKNLWNNISEKYFIEFSTKMLDLYKNGNKLGIHTSDIHENNIGYRGDELVAFDCM